MRVKFQIEADVHGGQGAFQLWHALSVITKMADSDGYVQLESPASLTVERFNEWIGQQTAARLTGSRKIPLADVIAAKMFRRRR